MEQHVRAQLIVALHAASHFDSPFATARAVAEHFSPGDREERDLLHNLVEELMATIRKNRQ